MTPKALLEAAQTEADALTRAYSRITEEEFDAAVRTLMTSRAVCASGCGHSGYVLTHFVHLLCCANIPARFISTNDALHGELGFVLPGMTAVFASLGGKTPELMPIMDVARKRGAKIISVTGNAESPLAKEADIALLVDVTREIDPLNTQGTTSFTVFSVLFDAIQCEIMRRSGETEEDYGLIHPGGAIGERLNGKGPDIHTDFKLI